VECQRANNSPPGKSLVEKIWWLSVSWAIGGMLEAADRTKFHTEYLRPKLGKHFPDEDTIFEYKVDLKTDKWVHWKDLVKEWKYPGDEYINNNWATSFIPTIDSTRLNYFLLLHFTYKRGILLFGGAGTAKTVTIENFLKSVPGIDSLDQDTRELMTDKKINFSFMTTPNLFQNALTDCVEKRQGKYWGPKRNKRLCLFIDDIAMPEINNWGDQITNEIVRQVVEEGRIYSLEKPGEVFYLLDMQYAGAMSTPGGGKNDIPNRLKRHFTTYCVPLPSDASLQQIFGVILQSRFHQTGKNGNYTQATIDVADRLTEMSLVFWKKMQVKMLPTPAKFHYNFNVRDLSNICQGICRTERDTITDEYMLVNL
jgi:dynein heavy chain